MYNMDYHQVRSIELHTHQTITSNKIISSNKNIASNKTDHIQQN